jgi:hypothetical protein
VHRHEKGDILMRSVIAKVGKLSWLIVFAITVISCDATAAQRINPNTDLEYLGAFRMPSTLTFDARGYGLTFYPAGNGGKGSLYITQGHVNATNGNGTAEISIPTPVNSKNEGSLNRAALLQSQRDITLIASNAADQFGDVCYMPKQGPQTTDKLYWSGYLYYTGTCATVGSAELNLASSNTKGTWWVGNDLGMTVGKYLFEADHAWADIYASGRYLIVGRHREAGGQTGSKGPTLYAIAPWSYGNAPSDGTVMSYTRLLEYPSGASGLPTNFPSYAPKDTWRDAVWLKAGTQHAVLFVGMKGTGSCYGEGSACGDPCDSSKGYHSYPYSPRFIWYDVDELAQVAQGKRTPDGVVPYSDWTPTSTTWKTDSCSKGYGGIAYDTASQRIYVVELYADSEDAPIVHVLHVKSSGPSPVSGPLAPEGLRVQAGN